MLSSIKSVLFQKFHPNKLLQKKSAMNLLKNTFSNINGCKKWKKIILQGLLTFSGWMEKETFTCDWAEVSGDGLKKEHFNRDSKHASHEKLWEHPLELRPTEQASQTFVKPCPRSWSHKHKHHLERNLIGASRYKYPAEQGRLQFVLPSPVWPYPSRPKTEKEENPGFGANIDVGVDKGGGRGNHPCVHLESVEVLQGEINGSLFSEVWER